MIIFDISKAMMLRFKIMKMEYLINSLNNILNSYYSVIANEDGTFEVQDCYNINIISYESGIVKFVEVKRNNINNVLA